MRNIKELLTVMLDNENLFDASLCDWVTMLNRYGKINVKEYLRLQKYLTDNVPFLVRFKIRYLLTGFWWTPGNIKPRIKWIKNI